jgi:TRAP-type C4-dicarboxylate transport system permease large subunit
MPEALEDKLQDASDIRRYFEGRYRRFAGYDLGEKEFAAPHAAADAVVERLEPYMQTMQYLTSPKGIFSTITSGAACGALGGGIVGYLSGHFTPQEGAIAGATYAAFIRGASRAATYLMNKLSENLQPEEESEKRILHGISKVLQSKKYLAKDAVLENVQAQRKITPISYTIAAAGAGAMAAAVNTILGSYLPTQLTPVEAGAIGAVTFAVIRTARKIRMQSDPFSQLNEELRQLAPYEQRQFARQLLNRWMPE